MDNRIVNEPSDIVDIYIQTTSFFVKFYKLIISCVVVGVIFGYVYFKFSTPTYSGFFITKNGNSDLEIIKAASIIDTVSNDLDIDSLLKGQLAYVQKFIVDTIGRKHTLQFNVVYKGYPVVEKLEQALVECIAKNVYLVKDNQIKEKLLKDELAEVSRFIDLYRDILQNTDTSKLKHQLLNKNLTMLLDKQQKLNKELMQLNDFTILSHLTQNKILELTLKKSILFSTVIFFIFGIALGSFIEIRQKARLRKI